MARDIYTEVTNAVIERLEAGCPPWVKPWSSTSSGRHRNGITQRPYSGVNELHLWCVADAKGYASSEWYTFKQVGQAGGSVKAGEHGCAVVYWQWPDRKRDDDEERPGWRSRPWAKVYVVFNREQTTIPATEAEPEGEPFVNRIDVAEEFISSSGAAITFGGSQACYSPSEDKIRLPKRESFSGAEEYYQTAFHELSHWTGHESRCNRAIKNNRGSDAYAVEELVAELAASFLCADCGIDAVLQNSVSYLAYWIKALKGSPRLIFSVAAAARKAHDYVESKAAQRRNAA